MLAGVTANAVPAGEHFVQLGLACQHGDLVTGTLGVDGDPGIVIVGG